MDYTLGEHPQTPLTHERSVISIHPLSGAIALDALTGAIALDALTGAIALDALTNDPQVLSLWPLPISIGPKDIRTRTPSIVRSCFPATRNAQTDLPTAKSTPRPTRGASIKSRVPSAFFEEFRVCVKM